MWIVRLALRRPYTFLVMAILIVFLGIFSIRRTPTDIFPDINIPVVTVVWTYQGLSADDMARRITTFSEYAITNTVNDIQRMESQTLNGLAVIRIFFYPQAQIDVAISQVTAVGQTILRRMPPGTVPPLILRFNASSVPVMQLALSGRNLTESQLNDFGLRDVRNQLATLQGITLPLPYGGAPRQIMVDIDPQKLLSKGLTANDVLNAVNAQNLVLPSGSAKIGATEYTVSLNSSPGVVDALNDLPVRTVNGATVYLRDVAHVRDGLAVQTNIVRNEGQRSVLLTVIKNGATSTLDLVSRVRGILPNIQAAAPEGLQITPLFDQSVFVSHAIEGVFHEALIACCLTGTLILLFLGSWRSTLIVLVSIPLSILTSIVLLGWLGFTINVMTLGGLALAIGILVDDATVTVENIHRHMAMGKPLKRAILDGAHQIAIPALVATLCICIVFVSVVFLEGPARFLFVPFALAVVFAVFMSYILSRTLVPVLVQYLLRGESAALAAARDSKRSPSRSFFGRFHAGFTYAFERFRRVYTHGLQWALISRITVLGVFVLFVASAVVVLPFVGQDFFPAVDAGQVRLHVKAAPGTRIEETERLFAQVEDAIREIIPAHDRELLIDNIGVPDPINLGFTDSSTVSAADGEILVSLSRHSNVGTLEYMKRLREELPNRFPGATFYFQPADIVNQILNFGVPAPIDVRIIGPNQRLTYPIAKEIEAKLARVPGAVDVHLHQIVNAPDLLVNVDRTRAAALNLTQRDIANNLLISLSSSGIVSPNYWSDPKTVAPPLLLAVQAPQRLVDSLQSLLNTPVLGGIAGPYTQLLANLATIQRREVQSVVTHTNIAPTYNVYANVQGRDLGSISGEINRIVAEARAKLPPGHKIVIEGQVSSMSAAFGTLGLGLIFAAVLVYLLMVVNFQSWLDPFIIIMALPGAFCGIVWMLYLTGTTFNVPSLMGSIMAVGVATANSILLVTFANEMLLQGRNSRESALAAGFTRLRPVLMTALAMIIGMIPMSLGLGEGGEQNAPLGRAVIGGLAVATITTLFVVPVIFSLLRRRPNLRLAETGDDQEQEARSSEAQPVY